MPYKVIHCKQCGARIGGETFPERMAKLRRHYKENHPRTWKGSAKRGIAKRKRARVARR